MEPMSAACCSKFPTAQVVIRSSSSCEMAVLQWLLLETQNQKGSDDRGSRSRRSDDKLSMIGCSQVPCPAGVSSASMTTPYNP